MNEREKNKVGHPSDYGSRMLDEPMVTGDGDPLEESGYLPGTKPTVENEPEEKKPPA